MSDQIEILAEIAAADGKRLIGRGADKRYGLGLLREARAGGYERMAGAPVLRFEPLTPMVSFGEAATLAEQLVAGAEKVTQRHALTLALAILAIRVEFEFPAPAVSVPAAAVAAPADESAGAAEPQKGGEGFA